jgi:hypothetical protein
MANGMNFVFMLSILRRQRGGSANGSVREFPFFRMC